MPGDLAYTDLDDMRISIRSRVGQHTSTKHVGDPEITMAAERARREINKRRPLYQFGTFTTIADQPTYAGAEAGTPPVNRLKNLTVYCQGVDDDFTPTITDDTSETLSTIGRPLAKLHRDCLALLRETDTTRMSEDMMRAAVDHHEFFLRFFGSRGFDDPTAARATPTIVVEPTPAGTGDRCYWIAQVPRFPTKADIPGELTEDYAEPFELFASAILFDAIAVHLAEQAEKAIGVAGIRFRTEAEVVRKAAMQARREFNYHCPRRSRVYVGAG